MNSQKSFFGYCIEAILETLRMIFFVLTLIFMFVLFSVGGYVTTSYILIAAAAWISTTYYTRPSVVAWNIDRPVETEAEKILKFLFTTKLPYILPPLKLLFFPLVWLGFWVKFIFKKESFQLGEFRREYFNKDVDKKIYEEQKREYEEEKSITGKNRVIHHPFVLIIWFLNILSIIVFLTGLTLFLNIVGRGSISPSVDQWMYFFEYILQWIFILFYDFLIVDYFSNTSFFYSKICISLAFVVRCLIWIWAVSGAHLYLEEV